MNTNNAGAHAAMQSPSRPSDALNADPDIDHALARLRATFPGLCIWHGEHSGSLWALLPDRLIEARTAADLTQQLRALGVHPHDVDRTATSLTCGELLPPARSNQQLAASQRTRRTLVDTALAVQRPPSARNAADRQPDGTWSAPARPAAPARRLRACLGRLLAALPRRTGVLGEAAS